jgi:hypothetical protein
LTEFEDYCFDFVVNKMNEICLTDGFREMDEISMKKLMEKVAKNKIFKSSHIYLYLCRIELNEQAFK